MHTRLDPLVVVDLLYFNIGALNEILQISNTYTYQFLVCQQHTKTTVRIRKLHSCTTVLLCITKTAANQLNHYRDQTC